MTLEKFCHEEEKTIYYKVTSKYLATHSHYDEISSKLFKLENIIGVETLL